MNEDELRAGLRAAVAGEPPMRLDPDRMATKAEVHTRRRRSMFGAAVGTLAVFGAVAVAPALTGQGGGDGMSAAAISSSMAPPPPEAAERLPDLTDMEKLAILPDGFVLEEPEFVWPPEGVSAPEYSRGELYERSQALRPYLDERIDQVVPEASGAYYTEAFGTEGVGDIDEDARSVGAPIYFEDSLGDGMAFVQVMAGGPPERDILCQPGQFACGYQLLDDGSLLVAYAHDASQTMTAGFASVNHLRLDGEVVRFSAYDHGRIVGDEVPDLRDGPSLNWDQLIELATDESITIF
ncbi:MULTISPECIES: hypothetical protein [Actinoalloteichus]|uniref:hypothetical protein n=1 Tax=Actinoalloteichus TaxID=65496 RepID=UPI0012F75406|nr:MULTISPECIES: hypothetical protein [Actinoalloteichus]